MPGTSPRTRGKLRGVRGAFFCGGNIPAHAGKTRGRERQRGEPREHPRARGENNYPRLLPDWRYGTSPRTRGKQKPGALVPASGGNIPAHAGKTRIFNTESQFEKEHPRARGENREAAHQVQASDGTSPRTRGKHFRPIKVKFSARNIPAHAGKTNVYDATIDTTEEHPRARGENCPPTRSRSSRSGTSPRTRGKRQSVLQIQHHIRNIPAHAGKTHSD